MAKKNQPQTPEEKLARALVPEDQQPYALPKGWMWTKLEIIAELITGNTPSKKEQTYYGNDVPFYKPADLDAGRHVCTSSEYLSKKGAAVGRLIPTGATSVCCIGSIGKCGFIENPGCTNQQITSVIPYFNNLYIYYLCQSPLFQTELIEKSSSTTISIVNKAKMGKCIIPLPPLPEQQRIVARIESLFAKLDAARDKLQQVLDTQEARRAAILHEAFTGRLTGHKGSAECRGKREKEGAQNPEGTEFVPEGWKRVKFSDIAEVKSNLVSPQDYQDFPHIAPDNIEKATGRLLSYHTIKEDKVTSPKHRFYPGQILYSKIRPYLSKVVIVDFDGLCSADMYPIETTENTRYLWYYMLSNEFLLQALSGKSRTVLPKINQKELAQIKVLVPPPDEQIVIVEKLDRIFMNEQKNYKIVRYSLSQIDLLKKSILARAFRGQLGTQDPSDPDARDLLTSE
ncbi:restriction endonuclease subunit S [Acidaminococcus timonensis]|uniref:restriction endonuclease subunit S n=1 Tax=Acidaminococcus timonensis TaxID=1871002 RepID=UPI00307D6B5B